jgi:hypothetical protein
VYKRQEYVSDGYTARFINPKTGYAAPYGEYVRWEDVKHIASIRANLVQTMPDGTIAPVFQDDEVARLKAEVERLTKQNALATPRHLIASQDIKTLREQIEELKLENSQYEEHHKYGQNVITSLREEVERLTKAGDAMADALNLNDDVFDNHEKKLAQDGWNAAKEGKGQP